MDNKRIYIIEDDQNICDLLVYKLQGSGFDAQGFGTGEQGLSAVVDSPPDVLLLDLMLPGMDGYEICRRIRETQATRDVYIIMLTARGEEGDRILGLEIGADDYMVKPFSVREVVAKVRAALRRMERTQTEKNFDRIEAGNLVIIPDKREAYKNGVLIDLKKKEFDLLYYLMQNAGRVMSREQLLDDIWGYDFAGETRTVDVHVSQLRVKIEDDPEVPRYIKTLRAVGYKFSDLKKGD
jgi:two-component system, OmpR family, alkaline phosphatase synthesis response regulator PhoP